MRLILLVRLEAIGLRPRLASSRFLQQRLEAFCPSAPRGLAQGDRVLLVERCAVPIRTGEAPATPERVAQLIADAGKTRARVARCRPSGGTSRTVRRTESGNITCL